MNDNPPETMSASIRNHATGFGSDEINLSALLQTVWRGKWWLALTTVLAIAIGGYYAFSVAVPTYKASSVVMLDNRSGGLSSVASIETALSGMSGDQVAINTEVEVIRSRALIEKLVQKLDLLKDPEFNEFLRPEPKISVSKIADMLIEKITGEKPPVYIPDDREILDVTINNVLDSLSVSNLRQSYVFRIAVVTEGSKKTADIANTLAELYILDQIEVKFETAEQSAKWLAERVGELQIDLEKADIAVKEFSTRSKLISPEVLGALNAQLKDLRDRETNVKMRTTAAGEYLSALKVTRTTGDLVHMSKLGKSTALNQLLDQALTGSQDATEAFFGQYDLIISSTEANLKRSENQRVALQSSIKDLEKQVTDQSAELIKLGQLQRETEANRQIYEFFLGRLKETSVQKGTQQADSRLLSRAVVPTRALTPKKPLILVLSALLGIFAGTAFVLLREMRQTGIRTAEDLEALTGLTVMGQIPIIPARRRSNVLKYLVDRPNSAAAEAIRNLRTSLLLSNIDNPPKIFMSTSSLPGEGKTTQSLALAQNIAGLGKKVLLIEGDIRRRVFREYFEIKEERGLLAVLSGDAELKDVVTFREELGADVLIGEGTTTNAADVFSSQKFRDFLKRASKQYDAVIIDTPPVLIVPDARVIGQSVDAIIYTVKWDTTSRTQVREGLRMLETVNLQTSGLVLGQIDAKKMKHYGYGADYGVYGGNYYHN